MSGPSWIIQWALNVITDVLVRDSSGLSTHKHRGGSKMTQKHETGGMWSQAKESWKQPKAERN